jgi:argininosuccinate synthase
MPSPPVVAYFGDRDSPSQLADLAASHDAPVIAVVLDLGGGPTLAELRASAMAAGALRCHAIDVRDDFVDAVIVPAAKQASVGDDRATLDALARDFVSRHVHQVAEIEHGRPAAIDRSAGWSRAVTVRSIEPVNVSVKIGGGEPIAVNDVPMTPSELVESLETICGLPAVEVLRVVFSELGGASDGLILLHVEHGACTPQSTVAV